MHSDIFPSELDYQAALSLTEGMHRTGLLTDDEMSKVRALLVDKYGPPLGSLFAIRCRVGDGAHQHVQEVDDARRAM
jgi:hypothetical protein